MWGEIKNGGNNFQLTTGVGALDFAVDGVKWVCLSCGLGVQNMAVFQVIILANELKNFQNAMSADDTKSLLRYRTQLDSVSEYIDKKIGHGAANRPVTMEAGMGSFKIATEGNPLENIKNQFGVRATLNKLVFGGSGKPELRKYVNMFGERGSEIGYEIERSFTQKS